MCNPFIARWNVIGLKQRNKAPLPLRRKAMASITPRGIAHDVFKSKGRGKYIPAPLPPPRPPRHGDEAEEDYYFVSSPLEETRDEDGHKEEVSALLVPETICVSPCDSKEDVRDDVPPKETCDEDSQDVCDDIDSSASVITSGSSQAPPPPPPPHESESNETPDETGRAVDEVSDLLQEETVEGASDVIAISADGSVDVSAADDATRMAPKDEAKPSEALVKAVVRLQAHARGRKARRRYKMLRWYHGLGNEAPTSQAPSKDSPGKRSTTSAKSSVFAVMARPFPKSMKFGNTAKNPLTVTTVSKSAAVEVVKEALEKSDATAAAEDPATAADTKPASPTEPSRPISSKTTEINSASFPPSSDASLSQMPATRERLGSKDSSTGSSTDSSRASSTESSLSRKAIYSMKVLFGGLDETKPSKDISKPISSTTPPVTAPTPEESEEAKKYAAIAKKVLLLRTTDYVAYLNALLKAHAAEDILSESKGIDAILNELLCFLAMKALGKSPVPSMRIHRAWRLLVLTRPLAYIEMCKVMDASSGFAINDENFDAEEDEDASQLSHSASSTCVIKERYECTRITYAALFKSNPPSEFWPPTSDGGGVVARGEVPGNHLEFLNEENLPRDEDLFSEFEIGSDTYTFVSSFDDDSLGSLGPSALLKETMEPAALLNELQRLAKEQNIDIANLSYDSIIDGFQRMHLWVDNTFFKQDVASS